MQWTYIYLSILSYMHVLRPLHIYVIFRVPGIRVRHTRTMFPLHHTPSVHRHIIRHTRRIIRVDGNLYDMSYWSTLYTVLYPQRTNAASEVLVPYDIRTRTVARQEDWIAWIRTMHEVRDPLITSYPVGHLYFEEKKIVLLLSSQKASSDFERT